MKQCNEVVELLRVSLQLNGTRSFTEERMRHCHRGSCRCATKQARYTTVTTAGVSRSKKFNSLN